MTDTIANNSETQRQRILQVTTELIESEGLQAISARKIASRMQCAVGSLYRPFENLKSILTAVNIETLKQLEHHVLQAAQPASTAKEKITRMAMAYTDYVMAHHHLWQTVMQNFDTNHQQLSSDYQQQQQRMFQCIESELTRLHPTQSSQAIKLEVRTLWAGIDGICNLGMRGKLERDGEEGIQVLTDILLQRFLGGEQ